MAGAGPCGLARPSAACGLPPGAVADGLPGVVRASLAPVARQRVLGPSGGLPGARREPCKEEQT